MEEHAKANALGMSIISPEMQEKSEQAAADFTERVPTEDILQGRSLEDALAEAFEHAARINTSGYPAGKKPVPEPAD